MEKIQNGARPLEELDLLQKTKTFPETSNQRNAFSFWNWRRLGFLDVLKRRRSRCVVCLQIHCMSGLPPVMDGRAVVVGWKTKGCKGEQTLPVSVCDGIATLDEIFLHYCRNDVRSILKSFIVWVSLVDAADCDLGTFHVDLSEFALADNLNSKFGGKAMSFDLGGMAQGGLLSLSVYCRMMEEEARDSLQRKGDFTDAEHNEGKSKCFSCLPDLNCLRSPPLAISSHRVPSLRSEHDFITIENSSENHYMADDEDKDFITIKKETLHTRSRRPPSDTSLNMDDETEGDEDEKPCLLMDLNNEFDVESVEDEFLRMLEEKYWNARDGEPWKKGMERGLNLSLDLSVDFDLDSLIREAELELTKAAQVWKSRVGAALLEKEEFEELMKRWDSNENSSSGCSKFNGFGSPI